MNLTNETKYCVGSCYRASKSNQSRVSRSGVGSWEASNILMGKSTIELLTLCYRRSVNAAGANTNNFNRITHEQTIKAITRKLQSFAFVLALIVV